IDAMANARRATNGGAVEGLSMQTLEISGKEESVRVEIHPKRGLVVLQFDEKRSMTFDVPPEGIRVSFSNCPRVHLAEGWRALSGVTEYPKTAIVLTKV